jgi:tetratricopeptide (TPR) repeat protein
MVMREDRLRLVAKAVELVRKRETLALGKHELAQLPVVRQRALPTDPPAVLGEVTMKLLGELLDGKMRPEGSPDFSRTDWRLYLLLQEYVFRSRPKAEVMADLGMREALFYETKSQAIETLADHLWSAAARSREALQTIPHNIPALRFDFISRVDGNGRDLVDVVVEGLQCRPWVVSIRGYGGVGKTTLAIKAAWAAVERGLFNRVAWVGIAPDLANSPDLLGHMLDTVGKRLGTRRVLAVEGVEERRKLVLGLLSGAKCLVVIDNTENVSDDQHDLIMQFVRDLPLPTCALIVSREKHRKTELETMIQLEGMNEREALRFLRARASEQLIGLDDEQAKHLFRVTRGNPRAMLLALGWMAKYGLPAQDVLDPDRAEMTELLDHLLGRVYERLDEDEERILNVMPLFSEPVVWPPIAAASGLAQDSVRVKTALGNLHARFLLDVDSEQGYSIAPLTYMFLQKRAATPGARTLGQPASEFWARANESLIDHCIDEFHEADHHRRLELVRQHKGTILDELRWAHDHDHHQRVTNLVYYIGRALGELGYWRDKRAWGEAAIRSAQKAGDRRRAAWHAIYDVGWTYIQRGELDTAAAIVGNALDEARELDYAQAVCVAQRNLGLIELHRGNYQSAVETVEHAVATAKREKLQLCLALAKATLGETKLQLGEANEAHRQFKEVLSLYEDLRSDSWESITLSQLALAALAQGKTDEATRHLERAEALACDIADPSRASARALEARGILQRERGALDEAIESLEQSLDTYSRLGQMLMVNKVSKELDATAKLLGDRDESIQAD